MNHFFQQIEAALLPAATQYTPEGTETKALDKTIANLGLTLLELPRPALFLAGKALVQYRRQGGKSNNVLADFFIGAHAAVLGCPLLTRDVQRYQSYFPSVKLITP
jgi:predicted nucleic acid-binding protein